MPKFATEKEFDGRRVALGMTVLTAFYDAAGEEVLRPIRCVGFAGDLPRWEFTEPSPTDFGYLDFVSKVEDLRPGKWTWTPRV